MRTTGPCIELVHHDSRNSDRLVECGCAGTGASLPCPSGRPNATAGPYCEEHGGLARAQADAACNWLYLAPASVGDETAVLVAGNLTLDSTNIYIVLRHEHERWLAWLGLGSHMQQVHAPGTVPRRRRREAKADYERRFTSGGYAFPSREIAEEEARRVWRLELDCKVTEIARRRGGTLAWGVTFAPPVEPIVVEVSLGGNAWDVAEAMLRRAPVEVRD
jgi:hypothetical protein